MMGTAVVNKKQRVDELTEVMMGLELDICWRILCLTWVEEPDQRKNLHVGEN
jgi:hypothetical protein